jgi:hypothetical protein
MKDYIKYPFQLQGFDLVEERFFDLELRIYLEERKIQPPCPKEGCLGGGEGAHASWWSHVKDIPFSKICYSVS